MKYLILCISLLASVVIQAQLAADSITIGPGYANQVWYSFNDGELESEPRNNWDLGFEIQGFTASILFNYNSGGQIWVYPSGDTSDWQTIDTTGLITWIPVLNNLEDWSEGALNRNPDPDDNTDLGWGIYNTVTHHVVGDSLFVLQTGAGDYKKLWIEMLAGGTYSFKLANLDGSAEISREIVKSNFPDKNFAYYSIDNDEELDREPLNTSWDLLFTRYMLYYPGWGVQGATGVLQNAGLTAAMVYPVDTVETFKDFESATFESRINVINHDWKDINFQTFQWDIQDSLVYFVYAKDGKLWKMVFTGFGGSSNGQYNFMKEEIEIIGGGDTNDSTTGVQHIPSQPLLYLYPNPSTASQQVTLVYDLKNEEEGMVSIIDIHGKEVYTLTLRGGGLQTQTLSTEVLTNGLYFVRIESGSSTQVDKLVVR